MIQFLRFDQSREVDSTFNIISGNDAVKFFAKRILYLILFPYSTLFLAVAIPFVQTPFMPVYFVGGLATTFYIFRFINHIIKYRKYKGGYIRITNSFVEIKNASAVFKIPAEEITYFEINPLGNLLIREKFAATSFPRVLLSEDDREALVMLLQDMAPKRTAIYKKIWEFVDAITVALVLAVHIIQYVIQAYYIPTGSMEETLQVGDHLFVEKITYGPIIPKMLGMKAPIHIKALSLRDIQRGDIVIFTPPIEKEKHKDYIKRCIALPGDEFHIKDGYVFINGQKLDEPYTLGKITDYRDFPLTKNNNIEGIVPEGKVIVLGDNRTNSSDSRYFGYLDITAIKGKAFILYWNTEQILKGDFTRLGLIK
ncbi:MAG TPA: signal peptidase I [Spirochaetota bacterium]|nr:signal peptidase I [Spirochaetota bacterium]